MSPRPAISVSSSLQRRLLNDIAEVQKSPYPNVHLYVNDANMQNVCLILTPEHEDPLHLTIDFPHDYPLRAPTVTIQSRVLHPNVFGNYICATILNTDEGWTSAYTLKGIIIQLLSFFSSDSVEQDYGGTIINLAKYRRQRAAKWTSCDPRYCDHWSCDQWSIGYTCHVCAFRPGWAPPPLDTTSTRPTSITHTNSKVSKLFALPDEIVLLLLNELETCDVFAFADAVPTIKKMVFSYDFIRIRELQCFCLKKSIMDAKLGIVKTNATVCLKSIHEYARMPQQQPSHIDVLYYFMNNIVVQFSADAEKGYNRPDARSTLSYASEKAVEAYFGLFHLLLCLAIDNPAIIASANRIVDRFLAGPRSKAYFPDLGHVLVAALISKAGLTEELTFHIIKEAILRNVVWMLDTQGAGMAELAYLEPSTVSDYRLVMTFNASPTSYRLLMFLKLFSSAARAPNKSLTELRDELFDTHSAPPPGTSAAMAQRIRSIREINSFPKFLTAMGIQIMPNKAEFTSFLRRTIMDSVKAGYSRMPMSQSQLYMIRKIRERHVQVAEGVNITPALERWFNHGEKWFKNGYSGRPTFFPQAGNNGTGRGQRERGAHPSSRGHTRGRGRGRGRGGYA
ncbi:hypothetical protein BKA66DRAFT_526840 [Pyrenochaeta sp. MPI-SDFR-AT-0127]|nr:hypothetical protein BKA66DRAFT_526840 [Pyrenochaeta sp. MPI-SDFR-AT-0127]